MVEFKEESTDTAGGEGWADPKQQPKWTDFEPVSRINKIICEALVSDLCKEQTQKLRFFLISSKLESSMM